jgi:hypothetical protein
MEMQWLRQSRKAKTVSMRNIKMAAYLKCKQASSFVKGLSKKK